MCASWLVGQLIMPQESIHLADLYKHDEIYWVPADRLMAGSLLDSSEPVADKKKVEEAHSSAETGIQEVSEVHIEAKQDASVPVEVAQGVSIQAESTSGGSATADSAPSGATPKVSIVEGSGHLPSSEDSKPKKLAADSFEYEPSLDAEALPKPLIPGTTWLVVGDLSGAERGRLQLIFSAPPMLLSEQDWAIYTPSANEPALSAFIEQAQNKKFIFLGQQPAVWQSDFQVTEIVQQADKLIYFFPRLLSSLTDAEKSLKLVFWNAIKDMK
jgi:hypothetical protein